MFARFGVALAFALALLSTGPASADPDAHTYATYDSSGAPVGPYYSR